MKYSKKNSKKNSKKKSKKKSKKGKSEVTPVGIYANIGSLNNLLLTVKLYHWTSDDLNIHKISDKFLKDLSPLLDKYVEIYLGSMLKKKDLVERKLKEEFKNISIKPISKKSQLIQQIDYTIIWFKMINHSIDLDGTRDDIVSKLQNFKYLLDLNN